MGSHGMFPTHLQTIDPNFQQDIQVGLVDLVSPTDDLTLHPGRARWSQDPAINGVKSALEVVFVFFT